MLPRKLPVHTSVYTCATHQLSVSRIFCLLSVNHVSLQLNAWPSVDRLAVCVTPVLTRRTNKRLHLHNSLANQAFTKQRVPTHHFDWYCAWPASSLARCAEKDRRKTTVLDSCEVGSIRVQIQIGPNDVFYGFCFLFWKIIIIRWVK